MIVQGVDNMAKLVNNLLDLGRIDFGVGLQVESIPVLDILERVTGSLQMQAKQKQISLGVEIPKDMPNAIEADQALLHQALYNLVENAIKYTPEGGTVHVGIRHMEDQQLILEVKDSGSGIPPNEQARIFEKFYRASNVPTKVAGSGLGLAIVKHIVRIHGGEINVWSSKGVGSTFSIKLPIGRDHLPGDK
mgnify:CR=1 FL=1